MEQPTGERARRRRRASLTLAAVVALVIAVLVAAFIHPAAQREQPALPDASGVPAGQLVGEVSAGRACRRPNAPTCDRVGIYVRLRRPARAVSAAFPDGRTLPLDDPVWSGRPQGGLRRVFADFLTHANLGFPGSAKPGPRLRLLLRVTRRDGTVARVTTTVTVRPGWG